MSGTNNALEILQREIGGCREELADGEKCWEPSEFVLWGKLLPQEALGPRCYEHAAKHLGRGVGDPQWAVVDLRRTAGALMGSLTFRARLTRGTE